MIKHLLSLALLLCTSAAASPVPAERVARFNVRDYGAVADGKQLDTVALNKAIDACAAAGGGKGGRGGQVLIPPGKYLTGTVHLKSNVAIVLDAGAELIGTPDLDRYD